MLLLLLLLLLKWNQIVFRLANERGPWGFSSEDNMDVFWKVDPTETDIRMHHTLIRNEIGTRHQMATTLARGKAMAAAALSLASTTPSISDVTDLDSTPDNSINLNTLSYKDDKLRPTGAIVSPQGLWRDLLKYQKSVSHSQFEAQTEIIDKNEIDLMLK